MRLNISQRPGAVHARRLVELLGDGLQRREDEQRRQRRDLPHLHELDEHDRHDAADADPDVIGVDHAERLEHAVQHAERGVVDPAPDDGLDDGRQRPGQHDQGQHDAAPVRAALQHRARCRVRTTSKGRPRPRCRARCWPRSGARTGCATGRGSWRGPRSASAGSAGSTVKNACTVVSDRRVEGQRADEQDAAARGGCRAGSGRACAAASCLRLPLAAHRLPPHATAPAGAAADWLVLSRQRCCTVLTGSP